MGVRRFAFVLILVLEASVLSGCGNSSQSSGFSDPSGQILYVINSDTVTTYAVDPSSLAANAVEPPVTLLPPANSFLQFDPAPDDHFVYAVASDTQGLQHLSVFATDESGVPQLPALQVLNATALSQFNMHPSGRFAYMLEVTNADGQYSADIRLFHAQPGSGTLNEDPHIQGVYGPSFVWPAFLYGFSADGTKLYDSSLTSTGSVYRERPIHPKTGELGLDTQLTTAGIGATVAISKRLIVEQYSSSAGASQSYVNILRNAAGVHRALIYCTSAMLKFCGTATNIEFDVSGNYLFFTDPATDAVHVAVIDLLTKKIRDTGNSIPMTAQTPGFAFSPDGRIVYAILARDLSVHFFHFDQSSGALNQAGTPLPIPASAGICPAQRH